MTNEELTRGAETGDTGGFQSSASTDDGLHDAIAPDEKERIVAAFNARYHTTLFVDLVEVAVKFRFTSWAALAHELAMVETTGSRISNGGVRGSTNDGSGHV